MRIIELNSHAISSVLDVTGAFVYTQALATVVVSCAQERSWRYGSDIVARGFGHHCIHSGSSSTRWDICCIKNRQMLIITSLVRLDFYKLQDFSYNRKIHPSVFACHIFRSGSETPFLARWQRKIAQIQL